MEYRDSPDDRSFRKEVRDWLEANKPREPRPKEHDAQRAYDAAWQRKQYDGGWAGINWPREYGGRGLTPTQQLIWCEEYAAAHCPTVHDSFWLAVNHAGPTLITKGSDEHKAFYLPKILRGETAWCQGFSEPGSGSDLSSLRTRGVVDGDHLVVNGQKIWTTLAQFAQYQELLVRTGTQESRHKGVTWAICDMSAPGITVREIEALDGSPHCCEVFYDNVRIPLSNVVSGVDSGWSVAMATLAFERGSASFGSFCENEVELEDLIDYARTHPTVRGGKPAIENEAFAYRLAMLRAQAQACRALIYQMVSSAERGVEAGAVSSLLRLAHSELEQGVTRLAMEIVGPRNLSRSAGGVWPQYYMDAFRETIAGGTSEIQRNTIGERVLGLPR